MRLFSGIIVSIMFISTVASCTDRDGVDSNSPDQPIKVNPPVVTIPIPETAPVIRVRLQRVSGDLVPVEFAKDGELILIEDHVGTSVDVRGPFTIRRDNDGWIVRGSNLNSIPKSIQHSPWLELSTDGDVEIKDDSGKSRRYSGRIRCLHIPENREPTWEIVEHVGIEHYLPGVLAGEMYGHWGLQCQAAQAIAARSFACMQIAFRKRRNWDVIDTAGSQAYLGSVSTERLLKACSMTSGMVLTWGSELVPGYFSSCCGGRAATATEAIGTNPINSLKPLQGHPGTGFCQDAPLFKWERTCDPDHLGSAIRSSSRRIEGASRIGRVSRIEITEANQHGRGVRLKVTDTRGNHVELNASELALLSNDLPGGRLYSGWVEGRLDKGSLHLSGHGYGHGAGLCQYGSAAMDRQGKSFWQMIEYYYPNAEVKKAW